MIHIVNIVMIILLMLCLVALPVSLLCLIFFAYKRHQSGANARISWRPVVLALLVFYIALGLLWLIPLPIFTMPDEVALAERLRINKLNQTSYQVVIALIMVAYLVFSTWAVWRASGSNKKIVSSILGLGYGLSVIPGYAWLFYYLE